MKYAELKLNDIANAPGIAISLYVQGCPHHCKGCFNQETWDFEGGKEFTDKELNTIIMNLRKHGIKRSLCILGGEPLCDENVPLTNYVISEVKKIYPDTPIYIWTGYLLERVIERAENNENLKEILKQVDYIVDGPFKEELKDLRLKMRGSSNQRIIPIKEIRKLIL